MNRSTQMTAERLFRLGFHHPVMPFAQFVEFRGDEGAFAPELFSNSGGACGSCGISASSVHLKSRYGMCRPAPKTSVIVRQPDH